MIPLSSLTSRPPHTSNAGTCVFYASQVDNYCDSVNDLLICCLLISGKVDGRRHLVDRSRQVLTMTINRAFPVERPSRSLLITTWPYADDTAACEYHYSLRVSAGHNVWGVFDVESWYEKLHYCSCLQWRSNDNCLLVTRFINAKSLCHS